MGEYTRQRQGRDFEAGEKENYLKNAEIALEGNFNMIDGIVNNEKPKTDDEQKESVLSRLERFRKEAEARAPVDGREPPERVR